MIDYLIAEEKKRIISYLNAKETFNCLEFGASEGIIKSNLNDIFNIVHTEVLYDLIYTFVKWKCGDECNFVMQSYFYCEDGIENRTTIQYVNVNKIPEYCEQLHIAFLNSKIAIKKDKLVLLKSKEKIINKGAVYTQKKIAEEIVTTTIDNFEKFDNNISILDFACGTGRFYDAIIKKLCEKGIPPEEAVLNNIYAIDIDREALNITRLKALSYLGNTTREKITALNKKIILKNGLIRNNLLNRQEMALDGSDFNGLVRAGFDIIVSNPPYLVLKANKNKKGISSTEDMAQMVNYFRKSGVYKYSIEGMLNLYQISIESMLMMLKPKGELGVICPSTLFADMSATRLRKHLLVANKVRAIKFFAEKIPLFENVVQATNIFYVQKAGITDSISIIEDVMTFSVKFDAVKTLFPDNYEIPNINNEGWNVLIKLSKCKKLKNLRNIRNRRGELDLTLCEKFITKEATPYRLVRGNMIGEKTIKDINGEFVMEKFVETRSKEYITMDFRKPRLICQQISNGGCSKRLKFIFCDCSDILANSCNYLSGDSDSLKKLYILLNSSLLNWRFKVTSSNNHINNYELDELPIVDLNTINPNLTFTSQRDLDFYVGKLYGLTKREIQLITN